MGIKKLFIDFYYNSDFNPLKSHNEYEENFISK